jgi:endonuclease/exonuclease/phosphatase family metal-dependent hydrolase
MKTCCLPLTIVVALLGGLAGLPTSAAPNPAANSVCVMSFNLRYASYSGANAWPERRPIMVDCLREANPDLIGTQEGVYGQLKDLAADLPEYEWIGLGREGGSRGEFMAIFYRRDRFEPLEFDHFWLSDTPAVIGSSSWGNQVRRMTTWVRFRDRQANREFYFFNTHLDHQVQVSREKSAELILQRINALNTTLPILLVGDFNATAGVNPVHDILVRDGGFADLWTTAPERRGPLVKTFHNYRGPQEGDDRIDWILARGPILADASEIQTCSRDGRYPSDHFPVISWIRWE